MKTRERATLAKNMAWISPGRFVMGSNRHYPEERPAHEVAVDGFAMGIYPVTNTEFRRFIKATGYLTTAEQVPARTDFPDADPGQLVPGSLVFQPTAGPVPLDDWRRWWGWVPGASWHAPEGPGSGLRRRENHPVVHVSYEDALAYAHWAGQELPAEAEWEYAARAGREPTTYAWGEQLFPGGRAMANTWQGRFPWENLESPDDRTTGVGGYPPNAWGLFDLIGNVWEWTSSPWTDSHSNWHANWHSSQPSSEHRVPPALGHSCCGAGPVDEVAEQDRQVIKGGSHLCAPSYCQRYRPPARQGQSARSTTSHLGFRCIRRQ